MIGHAPGVYCSRMARWQKFKVYEIGQERARSSHDATKLKDCKEFMAMPFAHFRQYLD